MNRLSIFILLLCANRIEAQDTCIVADTIVCLNACLPVTYVGPGSDTASYTWTSNCGTFDNPNSRQPGNHCYLFTGTCTLQVVVQEPGQQPDTCSLSILVAGNPDAVLEGDTTICAGTCTHLVIQFMSGTPPFAYSIDDGLLTNFYTSDGMSDTIEVCPVFNTTYTLANITDANGCVNQGDLNSVDVLVTAGVEASISQAGNLLCANPPGQNYQWYDCSYTTLLANSACYTMAEEGCFCVIVSDQATGQCVDTACGDFIIPCDLACEITATDSVCDGENFVFIISENGSASAVYTWTINSDQGPVPALFSNDSVIVEDDGLTWVSISLTIEDLDCQAFCTDTIQTSTYAPSAGFGNDFASCGPCVSLPVSLTGTPPFTLYIHDGTGTDTISNIPGNAYFYQDCPPTDDTITYTILGVTDSLSQCGGLMTDPDIAVYVYGSPVAGITQQGNQLCATAEPDATFEWFTCDSMQLLTFDSCFSIVDTGCYCLVVTNAFCTDTICGTFESMPCELTCNIEAQDTACLAESAVLAYTGNASPTATYNWLIDIPGFPMMPVSGNDSVILSYDEAGCYGITLTVFDLGCITICTDTVCVISPQSTASICCTTASCDTCTLLELNLTGVSPWTAYLTNGLDIDTISGIVSSPYFHQLCQQQDTTITYSLAQVIDGTNTCPAAITGDTLITVTLHSFPEAAITQTVDTLCATAGDSYSYGWYVCPAGPYLDTSRCFVPAISGCYCVDISTEFDCVDTTCYHFILSETYDLFPVNLTIQPNPSHDQVTIVMDEPSDWSIYDLLGRRIDHGHWEAGTHVYIWPPTLPHGIYSLSVMSRSGRPGITFLVRQ